MHLQVVCTLQFSSDITSLAAVSICGHQFFVVCTQQPNRARIFRLNNIEDDLVFQNENKKIWEFAYNPKNQKAQRNIFNQLQFPVSNPTVPIDQQFIEAKLGDNKLLLNFSCLQLTVTPIIDMKLSNPASSCLLTTFERSLKRMGPEEDIMPNEALFGMNLGNKLLSKSFYQENQQSNIQFNQIPQQSPNYGNINSIEKDQQYKAYEGALLVVGGQFGIVEYAVIPLAALLLDIPPMKYSSAIDVLKIGMQSKEQKVKHSIHELFTFPPESQIMDLGRAPVELSEENCKVQTTCRCINKLIS
ncbi:MAG: hypothetical protein EZS28_047698 [Streblomastix strix]|uniref:Uncharacterized protein n=1 Tax=Streblomastix strix TaxID=222440 RepID=A0A5J4TH73_9EUKA|nr:MAG: hypothetical protein EZS28_047698 [Streblomastix strix]